MNIENNGPPQRVEALGGPEVLNVGTASSNQYGRTSQKAQAPSDEQSRTITSALDNLRYDAIAEFADLAASYWRSIAEAASRGEKLTVQTHCRQVSACTREAFLTVKSLGLSEVKP